MRLSLRALVTDLDIRTRVALETLESTPKLAGRRDDAKARIAHIQTEARWLLDQDLDDQPETYYPSYQKLTQALYERETFELPFLVHHDRAAARATRLCNELLGNIKWPYDPLLVSVFSTQYYWTIPAWRVIALPCGEQQRLLAIGDLCHELGHTVYALDDQLMVKDILIELRTHLRSMRGSVDAPHDMNVVEFLTAVFFSWQGGWLQEFVCDMIATYLVGPAFPRQHARLRAMSQPLAPLYDIKGFSHPADDARMHACLRLLRKTGFADEALQLGSVWDEILEASDEIKPDAYGVVYPSSLMELLAETVIQGCAQKGLRPYEPEADKAADIPRLANEAWHQLESSPDSYAEWEESTVNRLWASWGV